MALPENIAAALADKPDVLNFVKGLDEKAARITPDVEADLPKLGEYKAHHAALTKILGDVQAKDAEALLTDFKNLKATNADLVKQRDAWKAGGKGADSPEYRALQEQIEANKTATAEIQAQLKAAQEKATAADVAKRETDLKAAVIAAAAKGKARAPEDDFLLLKAKGLVGYKEDGTPFYHKLNEKGEKVAVGSPDELLAWYLAADPSRVGGSGNAGPGASHRGTGGEGAPEIKSREEARAAFRAARSTST